MALYKFRIIIIIIKTLIEKKAHYRNQKAPLSNLCNLPQGWEPMV